MNHDLEFGKPGEPGLVIRVNPKTGERSFDHLIWGLEPAHAKGLAWGSWPIWARAETVATDPLFADAFKHRRGIAAADSYFQNATRGKIGRRWTIFRADKKPMAWAALWEAYRQPTGEIVRTYCIITVEANVELAKIHDRMPLIIADEDLPVWLGEEPGDYEALARKQSDGILALTSGRRAR